MSRGSRLVWKQSIKYFLILALFLFGVLLYQLIGELPVKAQIITFSMVGGILAVSVIFDLLSTRDILPIFQR